MTKKLDRGIIDRGASMKTLLPVLLSIIPMTLQAFSEDKSAGKIEHALRPPPVLTSWKACGTIALWLIPRLMI
jgi:hypothetical protein